GFARALAEEIRIATKVLDRRESDRINAVFDPDKAGGRKFGDPMSERFHEIIERVAGQRAVDPAVPFSQLRVVILRAQHDLKCPRTAHEAHEMLNAATAGDLTECRLRLTENR